MSFRHLHVLGIATVDISNSPSSTSDSKWNSTLFQKISICFFLFSKKVAQPKLIAIAFYPIKMCLLDFVRQTVI